MNNNENNKWEQGRQLTVTDIQSHSSQLSLMALSLSSPVTFRAIHTFQSVCVCSLMSQHVNECSCIGGCCAGCAGIYVLLFFLCNLVCLTLWQLHSLTRCLTRPLWLCAFIKCESLSLSENTQLCDVFVRACYQVDCSLICECRWGRKDGSLTTCMIPLMNPFEC